MQVNEVLRSLARHQLVDGYPLVIDLEKSQGSWIHDAATGDRYLDAFTCFASWPLGYNHAGFDDPEFEASLRLAARSKVANSDIYSVEMAKFVRAFATNATPDGFPHHFWVSGGSLAVENAMKTAFDWKARRLGRTDYLADCNDLSIVHFNQAFHGRSGYTMSVTNTLPDKVGLFPRFSWPRIHNPVCEFDMDGNVCNDIDAQEAKAYEQLDAAFAQSADRIAAILIEPMQGEGGDNHFRPEFMAALRKYADDHDCLLLFDEVQTGFFGSGKPWYWQHLGVAPDVVAFGKKSQVCGIYAGGKVDEVEHNVFTTSSRINSTWGGNLVDMVRSRRFIEIIVQDGLAEHALEIGERLKGGLRSIARETEAFSSVRGVGTLIAVTFPTPEHRAAAVTALFDRKTMVLPCGQRSMRFRMPLTMSFEEIDELLSRTADAIKSAHIATLS